MDAMIQERIDPAQAGAKYLANLTAQQREAVTRPDGPLLVLSGAGTGKTKVLTARIAWRLSQGGLRPGNMLTLTFTHKAADEMKARLAMLIGPAANVMDMGTYHGVFAKAIRECDGHLALSGRFSVLDGSDQRALLGDAYVGWKGEEEWKAFKADHKVDVVIEEFSKLRMSMLPGQPAYASESGVPDLPGLMAAYTDAKRAEDVADYDDILFTFDEALDNPRILHLFRSKWRMILIDEYQDTNAIQSRIVEKLAGGHRNLTCVGDDDQSIYGWRGADVRNILGFEAQWPEGHVVRLEHNFRSAAEILRVANSLIACNSLRFGKTLRPTKEAGSRVRVVRYPNSYDEADEVVAAIVRLTRDKGVPGNEIAVITRTATVLQAIETRLMTAKPAIPYTLTAGRKLSERMEMKVIAAYARAGMNPQDQTAFVYAFESRRRKLGKVGISRYRESARQARTTLEGVMRQELATTPAGKREGAKWQSLDAFLKGLDEVRAMIDLGMSTRQVVETIIEVSEIQATIDEDLARAAESKDRGEQEKAAKLAKTRQENLEEILVNADDVEDLMDLTTNIVLSNEVKEDVKAVWLGTIHGAKGLEFEHVFLPAFEAEVLPSPRVTAVADSLEFQEERNLAYVAITRAKRELTISFAMERRMHGQTRQAGPSSFLVELGVEERLWG